MTLFFPIFVIALRENSVTYVACGVGVTSRRKDSRRKFLESYTRAARNTEGIDARIERGEDQEKL